MALIALLLVNMLTEDTQSKVIIPVLFCCVILLGGIIYREKQRDKKQKLQFAKHKLIKSFGKSVENERQSSLDIEALLKSISSDQVQDLSIKIKKEFCILNQKFQEYRTLLQSSQSEASMEKLKKSFFHTVKLHQLQLTEYKKEIKQKNMIKNLESKFQNLTDEILELEDNILSENFVIKLDNLKAQVEEFKRKIVEEIQKFSVESEFESFEIKSENAFKDFTSTVQEIKKLKERKERVLKKICKPGKDLELKFMSFLKQIPTEPNDDYLDFAELKKKLQPLEKEATEQLKSKEHFVKKGKL